MYRAPSKRKKRAQLTLVYLLMVFTILSAVAVLVLIIMGYRFNRYDGKIEQGGLVQFISRPSGANVYIDGIQLANRTPSKITTSASNHTIVFKKDGYREWQKNITIKAGSVRWLDYIRLVPLKPVEKTIARFTGVSGAIVSSDSKHLLVKEDAAQPFVYLVSIDNETPTTEKITLNNSVYTHPSEGKSQSFAVESWDESGRYALLRHNYDDDKVEWLTLDTRGDHALRNITVSLGVKIKSVEFEFENSAVLYMVTETDELRRIDLGTSTISGPLVMNVREFAQYDRSTVTYATSIDPVTKQRSVGYLTDGAKKVRTIRSYADSGDDDLHLSIGRYYNKTYLAVVYGETLDVLTGDLPVSDSTSASALQQVAALTVPAGAKRLGFSPDRQRFIYTQNDTRITVFDLEHMSVSTASLDSTMNHAPVWVDNYHFIDSNGGLKLYEFDGNNRQDIVANTVDLPALVSPDDKYLFSFRKSADGVELIRSQLFVD